MNGQGKLLTHYLKNADKLIIPVYQRNYDWREEHCKKLYQDLVRTIQNKKRWHFFGGIVSVSDPMGSSSDYLVIDGQQRITTVSLLLLAMANLIKDGKVVPEDDTLYAQITKKYLVDEINPKKNWSGLRYLILPVRSSMLKKAEMLCTMVHLCQMRADSFQNQIVLPQRMTGINL